jgi:hypothetical protein
MYDQIYRLGSWERTTGFNQSILGAFNLRSDLAAGGAAVYAGFCAG